MQGGTVRSAFEQFRNVSDLRFGCRFFYNDNTPLGPLVPYYQTRTYRDEKARIYTIYKIPENIPVKFQTEVSYGSQKSALI